MVHITMVGLFCTSHKTSTNNHTIPHSQSSGLYRLILEFLNYFGHSCFILHFGPKYKTKEKKQKNKNKKPKIKQNKNEAL